jgi:ribosomal protein S18 acetylase RimI-like enzyme
MAGFRLTERFYCYFREIADPIEEFVPLPDLSLLQRCVENPLGPDLHYQIYHRRIDWVGGGRVVRLVTGRHAQPMTIAYVTHLEIDPRWRQQNIGRWLLRRMINDATMQGVDQMVVHLSHSQHAAINLFVQHGFQELNYRGYTLDKELTA